MMSIRYLLSFLSLSVLLGCHSVFAVERSDSNIAEYIEDASNGFTLLTLLVNFANATQDLSADGPLTVFAPTNTAINELIALFPNAADFASETELIQQVLNYHVVEGEVLATNLTNGMIVTAVSGNTFAVNRGDDGVSLTADNGEVGIVATNALVSNGVIHTIDKVMIPQEITDFLDATTSPSFSPSAAPSTSSVPTAAPSTSSVPTIAPTPQPTSAGVPQVVTCVGTVVTLFSVLALM